MEGEPQREKKVYNKIVRDKIPEFIKNDNLTPEIQEVSPEEAVELLKQKLIEEAQEVASASSEHIHEELADLEEVIRALVQLTDSSIEAVESVRVQKREQRGGFDKRIKLISTF